MSLHCILALTLVALSPAFADRAAAVEQYYRAIGAIITAFNAYDSPGHTNTSLTTNQFVCVFGGESWRIDTDSPQNAEVAWHFDGTNVYKYVRITNSLSSGSREVFQRRDGLAGVPLPVTESNVTLSVLAGSGGIPLGDPAVQIPWLAFCSSAYLKRSNRLVALPIAIVHHHPDAFAYKDKTITFNDALALPRVLDLFSSRELAVRSVTNFYGHMPLDGKRPELSPTFVDGTHKFHYDVTLATNIAGANIPLVFTYYQTDLNHGGLRVRRYTGTGFVKSVEPTSKPRGVLTDKYSKKVAHRVRLFEDR